MACFLPSPVMTEDCRFVLLGTGGNFTSSVVRALTRQGYIPQAYIQSGSDPQSELPPLSICEIDIEQPDSRLKQLLDEYRITLNFQSAQPLASLIAELEVDYLLVACWPELLAQNVLRAVSIAALNLHPSLLPAFRGADPITHQISTGDANFGISLHLINERFDQGDIVLQQPIDADNSIDKTTIENIAAESGAALFIQAVNTRITPGWQLVRQETV